MPSMRKGMQLLATTSVVSLFALGTPFTSNNSDIFELGKLHAQEVQTTNVFGDVEVSEDDQLLLESDEIVFDNDRSLVIALGNVQIAFGKFTLVADKVEYNQQSGRLIAIGNVEILEPNGNRIFAQEIDITDDFRDGFVSALNVATPDNTRIAAESADRRDGQVTAYNDAVYTACKACAENPEKPPFWQIRAKKVTIDENKKTIEYEDARLEFFGKPVAVLSRFSHADPAVKRKSGFLIPDISDTDNLGFGVENSYFFNLAPNYDLTLFGTYYTRQGFLGAAEWRHRTQNGEYSIRYSGIDQQDQGAFSAGSVDQIEDYRDAVTTQGLFDINDYWQFGWNALFQSDNNFARTYEVDGFDDRDITNEVFLTGIGEKNYFDLRGQDFLVQDNLIDFDATIPGNQAFTDQQADVLPVLDYNAVSGEEHQFGQVSFDLNVTSIERDTFQISNFDSNAAVVAANERFTGIEGRTTRTSAELEWKGSNITDGGAVVTTALSVRGDAIDSDTDNLGSTFNPLTSNESIFRATPAAMLEIRYPLIATGSDVTQIFEPIGQVIARTDETDIGAFANEDAQSLVFDTTNLFERDKFSGFDRVEGGTRANLGFRYSATFNHGGTIDIVAGQSFQLAGENSFAATNDLVNAGEESGLETDRSDYVASLQASNGAGISGGVAVRLDEEDLGLQRAEVGGRVVQPDYTLTTSYIFTEAQPNYRFPTDRHEIRGSGSVKLNENWSLFGSLSYDIENEEIIDDSLGLSYHNDCFSFSVAYSNLNSNFTGAENEQSITFSLGLRTVGGFQQSFSAPSFDQ